MINCAKDHKRAVCTKESKLLIYGGVTKHSILLGRVHLLKNSQEGATSYRIFMDKMLYKIHQFIPITRYLVQSLPTFPIAIQQFSIVKLQSKNLLLEIFFPSPWTIEGKRFVNQSRFLKSLLKEDLRSKLGNGVIGML